MENTSKLLDSQRAGPELNLGCRLVWKFWWLAPVALGAQTILIYVSGESATFPGWAIRAGIILTYLLILAVIALNLRWLGMKLLGLGVTLNFLAIVANGGLMPLNLDAVPEERIRSDPETYQSGKWMRGTKSIVLDRDQTTLAWFSDTLNLPNKILGRPMIFSLGDVVIALGLPIMALTILRFALLSLLSETRSLG